MKSHTYSRGFSCTPDITSTRRRCWPLPENLIRRQFALINHGFRKSSTGKHRYVDSVRYCWNSAESSECSDETRRFPVNRRRDVLVTPFLIIGGSCLLQTFVAKADEKGPESLSMAPTPKVEEKKEDVISSRIYDATVIGEPLAVGKDKWKIWEKLMNARIVYLGEAEQVPIRDDKELELEIVKNLRKRCVEMERPISLAMEAFPCNLQEQLNQYMDKRIDGETLKSYASHWPPERWQEYEPLLTYCRDNGVRLVACGTPLENLTLNQFFLLDMGLVSLIVLLRYLVVEGLSCYKFLGWIFAYCICLCLYCTFNHSGEYS